LQWENPGWHSRLSEASEAACAFTVAGQWRSFTALPEHSVAGKSLSGTTAENEASRRKECDSRLGKLFDDVKNARQTL
jgi:hypothetical protein